MSNVVTGSLGVGRRAALSVGAIGSSVCVLWTTFRGDAFLGVSDASVCVDWTIFLGDVLLESLLAGGRSRVMRRHLGGGVPVTRGSSSVGPVLRDGGESGETPGSRSGDGRY